jgi:hypothetical protein
MRRKTLKEFIEKAKSIHPEYDYSLVKEYKNNFTKVKIICPKHGIFEQDPHSHVDGKQGCPKCKYEKFSKDKCKPAELFLKEAKAVHPEYDYSLVDSKNARTKIKLICQKHGEFEIFPFNLLSGKGCNKCAHEFVANCQRKSLEEFISEARKVHGNRYDYSKSEYIGMNNKIEIICSVHGSFFQIANDHLRGKNCPYCKLWKGEEAVADWLDKHDFVLNESYFRQYKFKGLGNKSYDFYVPSRNVLIEYNGEQHYKPMGHLNGYEKLKRQRHSDWIKRKFARDKGLKLVAISYKDFEKISDILEREL